MLQNTNLENILSPIPKISLACFILLITLVNIILLVRFNRKSADSRNFPAMLNLRLWSVKDSLFLTLVLTTSILAQPLIAAVINYFQPGLLSKTLILPILIHIILFHGSAITTIIYIMRYREKGWGGSFGFIPGSFLRHIRQGIAFYILTIPVILLITVVSYELLSLFQLEVQPQNVIAALNEPCCLTLKVFVIFAAVIIAPIIEEIIFRGIALPLIAKHFGIKSAIVLTSLLFATVHFHLPSFIPLFALAAAMSIAYTYSGSIIVPIVMHMLFNIVNIAILIMASGRIAAVF